MMQWWEDNGYDPNLALTDRIAATKKLTDNLKENYDRAKKRIYKVIQKNNDVFNVKEFDYTQNISTSAWGLDIKVNNNFVHRYL
jgi:hypothetical protein